MRHGWAVAAAVLCACSSASAGPPNDASVSDGADVTPCVGPEALYQCFYVSGPTCPPNTTAEGRNSCGDELCCPTSSSDAGDDAAMSRDGPQGDAPADVSHDGAMDAAGDSTSSGDGQPGDGASE
jgi:hypothetical protein